MSGLPPANAWISVGPCSSPDESVAIIDNITITGSPGAITSYEGQEPLWSLVLNDGGPLDFRVDRYQGGALVDSPIYISRADGSVTLTRDPAVPLGAATKKYVDNAIIGSVVGVSSFNIRTGAITLTSSDVMTALGYAPVSRSGDTMAGTLVLAADPAFPLEAATKRYVDGVAGLSPISELLTIATINTLPNLSFTPRGSFILLIVNGLSFLPVGSPPPFSVAGNVLTWSSTIYSLNPGDNVAVGYFH
jgi:hypothetical protein